MTLQYNPQSLESIQARIGNEPLRRDKRYIIASTDLELSDWEGGPLYLSLSHDQIEYKVPTIITEVLEDYLVLHSPLSAPKIGRITMIK